MELKSGSEKMALAGISWYSDGIFELKMREKD